MNSCESSLINRLKNIQIEHSILLSDMTGTLLRQTNDGSKFPEQSRLLIATYIEKGGTFVLITGDSFSVAKQQFSDFLPIITRPYFMITEAGAEIHEVKEGVYKKMYTSAALPYTCRAQALAVCIDSINRAFDIDCGNYIKEHYSSIENFLQGGRLEITPLSELTGKPFILEAADYKITVFAEAGESAGSQTDLLLHTLQSNADLIDLAKTHSAFLMRGAIYFELIANSKEQGVESLFQVGKHCLSHLTQRTNDTFVLTLGDSPNDEGLFLFSYSAHLKHPIHTTVFLGVETNFLHYLQSHSSFRAEDFFHLKGRHELGTLEVLRTLCT